MELVEHSLGDWTQLRCRIFRAELGGLPNPSVLVLRFSGAYREGTSGNGDAVFMRVMTMAALAAWEPDAVVFDLRELDYRRGNAIWSFFGHGIPATGAEGLPSGIVVSNRCSEGFATCAGLVPPAFPDVESAVATVGELGRQRLKRLSAK